MRTFLKVIGVLVVLGIIALLAIIFVPVQRTPAQTALAEDWQPEEGHGEYAMRLSDCMACHTEEGGEPFAGNRAIESPLGTIYSTNITPDEETGIGGWSLADFRAALYDGVRPDGTHLYPAMPYENFRHITEEDVRAMYDYFMNEVEPVNQQVEETALSFPFDQRWGLRLWKWVALDDPGFVPEYDDPVLARGEYIVEGPGHCSACHSPRNTVMAQAGLQAGDPEFLAGGEIAGWTAPPLRGPQSAVRGWSEEDIAMILGTGRNAHAALNGEMQLVARDSSQYFTDEDLGAVAAFLVGLNDDVEPVAEDPGETETERLLASASPEMGLGARLYIDNGNACHFVDGRGADEVFPELAGNSLVTAESPRGLLTMILGGSQLPSTALRPYRLQMPGFGQRLDDEEVAALASFVRSGWGNSAAAVDAATVADTRASLE